MVINHPPPCYSSSDLGLLVIKYFVENRAFVSCCQECKQPDVGQLKWFSRNDGPSFINTNFLNDNLWSKISHIPLQIMVANPSSIKDVTIHWEDSACFTCDFLTARLSHYVLPGVNTRPFQLLLIVTFNFEMASFGHIGHRCKNGILFVWFCCHSCKAASPVENH